MFTMNKKIIALIVLSVLAVISLIYGITTHPKSRAVKTSAHEMAPENSQSSSSQAVISTKRRAKRSKFSSWNRNPFIPSGAASSPSGLNLGGIMWDENIPKALINDVIVKKGDRVGANTIVEINRNTVTLNDGAKNFELKLKE